MAMLLAQEGRYSKLKDQGRSGLKWWKLLGKESAHGELQNDLESSRDGSLGVARRLQAPWSVQLGVACLPTPSCR
jgi:hypothetical protein